MDPFTILSLGKMVIGGMQNAKQQEADNARAEAMERRTRENTYKDMNFSLDVLNMRNQEAEQASNERVYQRQLQALKDRSKIMIASGEAGVGGSSIARLVTTNQMGSAYDQALYEANLESELTQSALQGKQKLAEGESRINNTANQADAQTVDHPWFKEAMSMAPSMAMLYINGKKSED